MLDGIENCEHCSGHRADARENDSHIEGVSEKLNHTQFSFLPHVYTQNEAPEVLAEVRRLDFDYKPITSRSLTAYQSDALVMPPTLAVLSPLTSVAKKLHRQACPL